MLCPSPNKHFPGLLPPTQPWTHRFHFSISRVRYFLCFCFCLFCFVFNFSCCCVAFGLIWFSLIFGDRVSCNPCCLLTSHQLAEADLELWVLLPLHPKFDPKITDMYSHTHLFSFLWTFELLLLLLKSLHPPSSVSMPSSLLSVPA